MAVSFEYIPSTTLFQSTADPLIIQVREDTNNLEPKYRFILQVRVPTLDGAITGPIVATLKTYPTGPNSDSAVFDVSQICDDYIGPAYENSNTPGDPITALGTAFSDPTKIISLAQDGELTQARKFTLLLGYEYASSPTTDPVEYLAEEFTDFYAFRDNFTNYGEDYARGDGDYQPTTTSHELMSTMALLDNTSNEGAAFGRVRMHYIGSREALVIGWGQRVSTANYIHLTLFEQDGTVLDTEDININTQGGDTTPGLSQPANVQYFGAGTINLFSWATENGNTSLLAALNSASLYAYEIHLNTSLGGSNTNRVSGVHQFRIDDGCSKYPRRRLMWLNRVGAWEFFNFDQKSVNTLTNINRTSYNRPRGNWEAISSSVDWTYRGYERGTTTTQVMAEKQEVVSSGFMDEAYADTLRDLAVSSNVFLVESATRIVPVVVTNSEYLFKNSVNDKLVNYQFTLRYANRPRLQ